MATAETSPVTLHVRGAAPIPVGQRVEIVRLRLEKSSVPLDEGPLVTHLETGITYGSTQHFMNVRMYASDQLLPTPVTLRSDLREYDRWSGTVLVCQVLSQGQDWIQTTLVVALDPAPAAPYR